jgi:hypothetical protein
VVVLRYERQRTLCVRWNPCLEGLALPFPTAILLPRSGDDGTYQRGDDHPLLKESLLYISQYRCAACQRTRVHAGGVSRADQEFRLVVTG